MSHNDVFPGKFCIINTASIASDLTSNDQSNIESNGKSNGLTNLTASGIRFSYASVHQIQSIFADKVKQSALNDFNPSKSKILTNC